MTSGISLRVGAYVSVVALVLLVVGLVVFWTTGTLAEGNHVARDFHEAGIRLAAGDRALGLVIAGLPVAFFAASLFHLSRFFTVLRVRAASNREAGYLLVRSSRHAVMGAILLFLYPTLLSFGFFLTQPPEHRTVLVSLQPEVRALLLVALLFFLVAGVVRSRLAALVGSGTRL